MSEKKPEVNLGNAAIVLAVIAVLGIGVSFGGLWLYGAIGTLAGIAAIGLGAVWFVTRRAVHRATSMHGES